MASAKDKKKEISSLIPLGDKYVELGINVLLIGLHGTGKTVSVMDLAQKHNLKMKYFSCSTLDPYTDLVGVPVPMHQCNICKNHYHISEQKCVKCDSGDLMEVLKSIRPRDVDDAEIIFADEFNRASHQTTNALFEMLQFKRINGEPLPNLRMVWAAINPPDNDYKVEELDPALLDRFDVYIEINANPSVQYMESQGIDRPIAQALSLWWNEQDRERRTKNKTFQSYISPRRLEKIGRIYCATKNFQAVEDSLPKGVPWDLTKLKNLIEKAAGKITDEEFNDLGKAAADFQYTPGALMYRRQEVADYIKGHPNELETQKKIIECFQNPPQLGEDTLVKMYGVIFDAITPHILESFVDGLGAGKKDKMKQYLDTLESSDSNIKYPNLKKVLNS